MRTERARQMLTSHFLLKGHSEGYVNSQIEMLFNVDGYASRFDFLRSSVPGKRFDNLLISGAAAGGEISSAQNAGARTIAATEIHDIYLEVCNVLFEDDKNVSLHKTEGNTLPFDSNTFDFVISGHIIEHSSNPFEYLNAHFNVLRQNGILFLEFPTRYNSKELHTGRPSMEWLPLWLRHVLLRVVIWVSMRSKNYAAAESYASILTTLMPVSVLDVWLWLKRGKQDFRIVSISKPSSGIVRCLIEKL